MNQITTRYITENGACYEQYVITDPEAKTALTITPERGGMITSFTLDGEEFVWTRRPNFSECNRPRFGVPVLFPSCAKCFRIRQVDSECSLQNMFLPFKFEIWYTLRI